VILTERRVVVRMTLNEMSELLPTNLFLRIHRSYLIALDKIEKIAKNAVEIKSKEIAIGASYEEAWAEAKAKLR
jgi:DNA-binding LytR/AlgR family response regulator